MPRWAKILLGVLAGLLLLLLAGVLVVTQTDFGRDRVRSIALDALRNSVHGNVELGRIRGNLLSGVTVDGVVITDSAGAPFLRADTLSVSYSLTSLAQKRIVLDDLRLVEPVIVLDKPPGGAWNFARIFPSDTTQPPSTQGFGAWVTLRDVVIVDGRVVVRNEWAPPDTLAGAARDSAISLALSPESRLRVERVRGGFQSVMDFRQLDARLPRVRLADPDSAAIVAEIAQLSTLAFPFRPPAARIQDLAGTIVRDGDTLRFAPLRIAFPGSRLVLRGEYLVKSGDMRLQATAEPFALADLQWVRPSLPDSGGGSFAAAVTRRGERTHLVARELEVATGTARLAGHADASFGDSLRLGPTDLRFAGVDTRLLERLAPGLEIPREGVLSGRVELSGDPAALDLDGRVAFAARDGGTSRLFADGVVGTEDGFRARDLRLRLAPLQLSLARAFRPDLPVRGEVTGTATLTGSAASGFEVRADLVHTSPRTGRSRLLADGAVVRRGEEFAARDLTLRFAPVQLALARAFRPDLPVGGVLTGRATLDGTPDALRVDADLVQQGGGTGRSHLLATGEVGVGETFRARGLVLRLEPLQLALARRFRPDLPLEGTLAGRATVNGSTATRFAVDANLVHAAPTGRSHLIGDATVGFGEPLRFAADLRAQPVSLTTLGQFAPAAGLQGSATGTLRAGGTLRDLAVALDLEVADGGSLAARGSFDLASPTQRYDLRGRLARFDAAAVSTRGPRTALTGTFAVNGRGVDPATLDATIAADLAGARVDSVGVDSVQLLARLADGLATFQRGTVRLASAEADIQGSFGLTPERSGRLEYRVRVDSLSDFAAYVPQDTSRVLLLPREVERMAAAARADSARIARATEVGRATGTPPEPTLQLDTAVTRRGVRRDSLAGSLAAEGVVAGNLERFDVRGTATTRGLLALGNRVGSGRASYTWLNAPTQRSDLSLIAALDTVRAGGFALDTVGLRVAYRGGREAGNGTFSLGIQQDTARDYRVGFDFRLDQDDRELRLGDLALRFDTTRLESTHPATVRWGGRGVTIDSLELRSDDGARVFVDGRLPTEGPSDLEIAIERLQIADVAAILQDTTRVRGLFSLAASVEGTQASPRFRGEAGLVEITVDTVRVPDFRANFAYADRELTADADLSRAGRRLLIADARVPIDLAFSGVEGERLAPDAPLALDVRADSLPLESLPSFTAAVEDVRGRVVADVQVRGTRANPDARGFVNLDLGSLRIVQPGLDLRDLAGTVLIRGDSAVVDSLVARSDGGPIRITGALDISQPTEPGFDLALMADGARVLNNEQGKVRADADLTIRGPWDGVVVAGNIHLREGVIYAPEPNATQRLDPDQPSIAGVIDTASVQVLPPPNPLLDNLRVDATVSISRSTWVRNTEANVEIYTPGEPLQIDLDRSTQALTLRGVVNTGRGEYEFSGQRFDIQQGAVVFQANSPFDPLLQLTATRPLNLSGRPELTIRILIGGTLREPTISVSSDAQPPISESDLLAYLAFGGSSNSLLPVSGGGPGSGGSLNAGRLGALAQQQLASTALGVAVGRLERGTSRQLGLDVFHITPSPKATELALENTLLGTELEVGKYVTPRLFVAGQGKAAAVLPGVRVEYTTPGGFQLVSSYEPRFLPQEPSLVVPDEVDSRRVFGLFLRWERRY